MQPETIDDIDQAANEPHTLPSIPVQLGSILNRTQLAYYSLLMVHARLMLDTMSRQGITDFLNGDYTFSLSSEVVEDLKGALNAESAERESYASRFKAQTPD